MSKEFENVGKLCPLCKKGIILYIHQKAFLGRDIEYTTCSNEDCDAFVRFKRDDEWEI